MRLIFLVALLSGCVQRSLRIYDYPEFSIVQPYPSDLVDEYCASKPGLWDDGTPRPKGAHVDGCYDAKPTIWVKRPEAITHEMAHHYGIEDPESSGYNWREYH